jgi:vacuolar protein sorting-associated protein 45
VVFVRPTAKNIAAIVSHLREPRFAEYHLCSFDLLSNTWVEFNFLHITIWLVYVCSDFTNIVPKSFLKQIAEADDQEAVRSVQEYFADFFAVNSDLFTLNIEQTRLLNAPHWGPQHNSTFSTFSLCVVTLILIFIF